MIRLAVYIGFAATYTLSSMLPQSGEGTPTLSPGRPSQQMVSRPMSSFETVASSAEFNGMAQLHGVVKPSLMADLPSLVPGLISTVHVVEGKFVNKGTPLVTLDDRIPRARLEAATVEANLHGALDRAKVELRMAEDSVAKFRQLLSQGSGGSYELEVVEGTRDQAAATVSQQEDVLKAAEATRKLAEAQLHQYTIVAPFDGLVTEIHQKSGIVDPSQIVISIANLKTLEVEMHVPDHLYGRVSTGNQISLQCSSPINGTIRSTVQSVSPMINSASRTFRCLLKIDNSNGRLPAGFTVTLQAGAVNNRNATQTPHSGTRPGL